MNRLSPFPFSDTNKRYHTYSYYLKHTYGQKAAKVVLDAGFTCPNRDGRRGFGGCAFCSAAGSGDTVAAAESLREQYEKGLERARAKWPGALGIAYFQAYSNTYAPTEKLIELYAPVFAWEDVTEVSIATRADCISEDFVQWLSVQSKPVWIELGLQTVNEETARNMNRGHSLQEVKEAVDLLHRYKIPVCLHIINGLPQDTYEDMVNTARFVRDVKAEAVKIHMLHVISTSRLGIEYTRAPWQLLSLDEYVQIVCDQLEQLPAETIVERITGDAVKEDLLAPEWTLKKTATANAVDKELVRRGSMQGSKVKQIR